MESKQQAVSKDVCLNYDVSKDMCLNYDDKINFINECFSEYSPDSNIVRSNTYRLIYHVGAHERLCGKDFCFFTIVDIKHMMEANKWTGVESFNAVKTLLNKYVQYQKDKGMMPEEYIHPISILKISDISLEMRMATTHFGSFDEFYDFLETIYSLANTNAYDDNRYLCDKTILCMYWLGFDNHEIGEIYKTSIDYDRRTITSKYSGKIAHNVDRRILAYCRGLSELEFYEVEWIPGSIKTTRLHQGNKLIRFATKNRDSGWNKAASSTVQKKASAFIKNLPKDLYFYKKSVKYTGIRDSGLYCRLYEAEIQQGHPFTSKNDIIEIVGKDNNFSRLGYVFKYFAAWKQQYHQD